MVKQTVRIQNPAGLYLNFAGKLCSRAMDFQADIQLLHEHMVINGKSILNVLGAKLSYGDEIEIRCNGEDEEEALQAISEMIQKETIE